MKNHTLNFFNFNFFEKKNFRTFIRGNSTLQKTLKVRREFFNGPLQSMIKGSPFPKRAGVFNDFTFLCGCTAKALLELHFPWYLARFFQCLWCCLCCISTFVTSISFEFWCFSMCVCVWGVVV